MDELIERLETVEQRLISHARGPAPKGLTDPDPGGTERWEAAQVWAHMGEFVGYWQAELERVVGQYSGTPVPFGRTKEDPGRISGIETGRHIPVDELMERVHEGIEVVRDFLSTLTDEHRHSVGMHARRGEMGVEQIVEVFIVDHLEEHADQLDGLR